MDYPKFLPTLLLAMPRVIQGASALLIVVLASILAPNAHAQDHFQSCLSRTGGNASIIVSTTINPTINGEPLESGDEIAVFTPEGVCAGMATWSGSNMAVTAWGDDSMTPEKDGFASGENLAYKVWDASAGVESDDVDVSYSSDQPFYRTDGTYDENAIYVLSAFAATTAFPESVDDAPSFSTVDAITTPEDGATLLIGGDTPEEAVSAESGISVEWSAAVDPESDAVEYVWELSETDDFSEPLLSVSVGPDTSIHMTYGTIADALEAHGVETGSSLSGYHRVVAEAGGKSVQSAARAITLTRGTITGVDGSDVPQSFSLDQNYPNPFNPNTTISYTVERSAFVSLKVYDVLGKEVATLVGQEMAPGQHSVRFNADMLNSGTYFYHLNAGSYMATKQMVLLK